ncbi:lytic transglycosylase domain-containing protein [Xenorhabdus sp. TS4]|uniref:lytic transglycosylase domain-containing protein n=1 Tax=Xenorhabdus sp. TS4 TaxID=1873483 RepID=UPI0016570AAF|nr:transglycosylase SLT domain-containing protein [Xenorhabdus sp. TS4]MBC8949377.1 putative transglycosylase signal peptide protein [Xenorhabdus sp. TS4]
MATLVDTLLVALKLDMSGFASDANKAIKALDDLDKKADGASTTVVKLSDGTDKAADSSKDLNQSNQSLTKSTEIVGKTTKNTSNVVLSFSDKLSDASDKTQKMSKSVDGAVKALAGLFTTIFVSSGLAKLVSEVSQSNDQLHFLSKNLGMNADTIKKWQNVAEMSGGSADGMAATMSSLNKSLWDLVTVGDASILPFFNALGVGVVDSYGKIRNLDDILLDMADSMSQMERPQAYNIAKNMGLDEGTINTLLEGRDAIQKRLDAQKNVVISTKEELELNRKLREQNSVLGQQWEGLKTIVANYLIPRLLKLSTMMTGFLEYLNKNRETALNVFRLLSVFLTLTLIPVLFRVGRMLLLAFAPLLGTTGIILALAAALWVLYDDYQTWKKGGDSVLNWKEWDESITWILKKLGEFGKWFKDTTIGKWFTDSKGDLDGFKLTLGGLALFLGGPWLAGVLTSLTLAGLGLLRFFGLPGALLAGAIWAFSELKSKIDNFDWDSAAKDMAKVGVKAAKAVKTVKKLTNAETVSEQGQVLFDTAKSLPEAKLITDSIQVGTNIVKSNTDEQGRVNWSGVVGSTVDSFNKAAKIAADGAKNKPKALPNAKKGNANELQGQAALDSMRGYFMELEKREGLDPGLLYGVAMAESSGNRFAIGPQTEYGKAKGPFQFIPQTAAAYGLKGDDVFDWYKSSDAAAKMLGNLSRKFKGDLDKELAGYNWGEGKMKRNGMEKMPKQTRDYIREVKKNMAKEQKDRKAQGIVQSLSDFQARMTQPLIPNMDMNAPHEFLAQTERIRNMPMAGATNNVKVDLNGDINVVTSANTVTGTVTDAGEAARLSLSQIMTSMG